MSELITALVSSVYSEKGIVFFDAMGFRVDINYTNVIVPSRFRYEAYSPQQGDKVLIQETDQNEYVLHSVLTVDTDLLPNKVEENEYVIKFDENTKVNIKPNDSGGYDIDLEASGDVNISAEGDVFVDEGGQTKKVAYADHTHDFEYDGGGEGSSLLTGTTEDPPDSDKSQVELE